MTALLIESALKCTALLLMAGFAVLCLRRHSAALKHRAWALALAGSLIVPVLSFLIPNRPGVAVSGVAVQDPSAKRDARPSPGAMVLNASLSAAGNASAATWIGTVWLLGAFYSLSSLVMGSIALRRLRMRSVPAPACLNPPQSTELLLSRGECMPMTWGAFRPCILLPKSAEKWSFERIRAVIAHESAHVRRHDWAVQVVAELARALYWFHPLVWYACARLRQESEEACDNAVLISGVPATEYAEHLLDLARSLPSSRGTWSAALAMARPSHLERRFTAMLTHNSNRGGVSRTAAFVTTLLFAVALVPLSSIHGQVSAGVLSGVVADPAGLGLVNATVLVTTPAGVSMTSTAVDGSFEVASPGGGASTIQVLRPGALTASSTVQLQPGQPFRHNVVLQAGVGGAFPSASGRIRVGGNVQSAKLIRKIAPVYPVAAKSARVQGSVMLDGVISKEGSVSMLRVSNLDIDPVLARNAVEAVSQWGYRSTLLNGNPVEVQTMIQVNYTLLP